MADAIVITGPTASGKSALSMAVAERLHGEIISMDSRQVYRGLDIGTAKPTREELQRVRHHGIDVIDPGERYSAGQFARDARSWIREIRARGRVPIVVGGTLFFLRALQEPLFDEPELDPVRRDRLRALLNAMDIDMLRRWASYVTDAPTLPVDRQRLARLVEMATLTGRPLAAWHARTTPEPGVPTEVFVKTLGRTELYRRIDERVRDMVRHGFVEEVRALVARGYGSEDPGMNATGYQELLPFVAGERSLDEAVTLIQAASRQYARRQLTWLRTQLGGNENIHELDATLPVAQLADRVEAVWRQVAA
jgi:tRNA dimethylallyltransferase